MENTDYLFTLQERLYFERLQMSFNTSVSAGVNMLCTQNGLDGQWRIKPDVSGLERVDAPAAALQGPPADAKSAKRINGVA